MKTYLAGRLTAAMISGAVFLKSELLSRDLFSHTSPVSVTIAGKSRFDTAVARQLLAEMETNRRIIRKHGKFAGAIELARVLDVYSDAIVVLRKRLNRK